jgi:hypothetical protein
MAGFLWFGSMYYRPDLQKLNDRQWRALNDILMQVADNEDTQVPPGFLYDFALIQMRDDEEAYREVLTTLTRYKMVDRIDDPDGWLFKGWTEEVTRFRAGTMDAGNPRWGQKPAAHWAYQRSRKAKNQADYQERIDNGQPVKRKSRDLLSD